MAVSVSKQTNTLEKESISKGVVKRKYLLTDEELEDIHFELVDNPLNKGYAPMKLFRLSEVEAVAIKKWGSQENLEDEQEKRRLQKVKLESKREDDKREFWDNDRLYEPMKHFLQNMDLPAEKVSPYFRSQSSDCEKEADDSIFTCDVIICYCDCMHSTPPGAHAKSVYKRFPEVKTVDKMTPFNDRRKMGHLSWTLSQCSPVKDQVLVNLYVVHKWNTASKARASLPLLNFDAMCLALRRFSKLLTKSLEHKSQRTRNLKLGTYIPYRLDAEKFKETLKENLDFPVSVYTNIPRSPSASTSQK